MSWQMHTKNSHGSHLSAHPRPHVSPTVMRKQMLVTCNHCNHHPTYGWTHSKRNHIGNQQSVMTPLSPLSPLDHGYFKSLYSVGKTTINHPPNHHKKVVCLPFPNGWFMALFFPHYSPFLLVKSFIFSRNLSYLHGHGWILFWWFLSLSLPPSPSQGIQQS